LEPVVPDLKDKLTAKAEGEVDGPTRRGDTFTVVAADAGELADLSTDWELLKHLAGVSGGAVYTPETAAELVERCRATWRRGTAQRAGAVAGRAVGVGGARDVLWDC